MTMISSKLGIRRRTIRARCIPVVRALGFVLTLSQIGAISAFPGGQSSDLPKPAAYSYSSSEESDEVDDYIDVMEKIIAGIITFVIVVVVVCLVLCFCCPICIIAKMRKRRGVVVRTGQGVTTTTQGNTVTVSLNRSAPPPITASPQVVAIPNNLNAQNKPYPVQESVTIVPLLQPQAPAQYPMNPQPMNINYPPGPAFPQNFELPPPYPGLSRDPDTANLPYNPYFSGDSETPSAPPPK